MASEAKNKQRDPRRLRAVVHGRVQGVSFRYYTHARASGLGLVGYVRNLSRERVEVVAEGDERSLQRLLSWLHIGPPLARVSRVDVRWSPPKGEFHYFEVRY